MKPLEFAKIVWSNAFDVDRNAKESIFFFSPDAKFNREHKSPVGRVRGEKKKNHGKPIYLRGDR